MKDLGYSECHKCGGNVKVVDKKDEFFNEKLWHIIKVTVPIWVCKDCGNEVFPEESLEIRRRCSGVEKEEK